MRRFFSLKIFRDSSWVSKARAHKGTASANNSAKKGDRVASFKALIGKKTNQVAALKALIGKKNDQVAALRTLVGKKNDQVNLLRGTLEQRKQIYLETKRKHDDLRQRVVHCLPAINIINSGRQILTVADDAKADLYVAHGVQSIPAAARLKSKQGGLLCCDVIETPSFSVRAVQSRWDPDTLNFVDAALEAHLMRTDFCFTVGWTLGDLLREKYGCRVDVIPNYRKYMVPRANGQMREIHSIPRDARVVLCISTVASALENVIAAMGMQDKKTYLVLVGKLVPESYEQKIKKLTKKLGLCEFIKFQAQVPYDELADYAAGADIGLIVRDPKIQNNFVSLPNRIFDYISADLPVVTPDIPDISAIIRRFEIGTVLQNLETDSWATAISSTLHSAKKMKNNAANARKNLTWEDIEDNSLLKNFRNSSSVTFVGTNNLTKNNRTMRMADSLTKLGIKVTVACKIGPEEVVPRVVNSVRILNY